MAVVLRAEPMHLQSVRARVMAVSADGQLEYLPVPETDLSSSGSGADLTTSIETDDAKSPSASPVNVGHQHQARQPSPVTALPTIFEYSPEQKASTVVSEDLDTSSETQSAWPVLEHPVSMPSTPILILPDDAPISPQSSPTSSFPIASGPVIPTQAWPEANLALSVSVRPDSCEPTTSSQSTPDPSLPEELILSGSENTQVSPISIPSPQRGLESFPSFADDVSVPLGSPPIVTDSADIEPFPSFSDDARIESVSQPASPFTVVLEQASSGADLLDSQVTPYATTTLSHPAGAAFPPRPADDVQVSPELTPNLSLDADSEPSPLLQGSLFISSDTTLALSFVEEQKPSLVSGTVSSTWEDSCATFLDADSAGLLLAYQYLPLEPDHIRLLLLAPGKFGDPIQCFLEHCNLNDDLSYRVISHLRDAESGQTTITVDGCALQTSRRTALFLDAYRSETDPLILWIDSLCVDKNNTMERTQQTQQLRRVHERAESVVIWLGERTNKNVASAFKLADQIWNEFWLPRTEYEESARDVLISLSTDSAHEFLEISGDSTSQSFAGLKELFAHPWWGQIWSWIEATAPTRCGNILLCGHDSLELQKLFAINRIMNRVSTIDERHAWLSECASPAATLMEAYCEARLEFKSKRACNFLHLNDLLPSLRSLETSDARDKLHALIPMSVEAKSSITIDYSMPLDRFYISTAQKYIESRRSLDILGHCTKPGGRVLLELPSWVPDWTVTATPVHLFKRGFPRDPFATTQDGEGQGTRGTIGRLYNASNGTEAVARFDDLGRRLYCHGYSFDLIRYVSDTCGHDAASQADTIKDWSRWLYDKRTISAYRRRARSTSFGLSPRRTSSAGDDGMDTALSHTLVADCRRIAIDVGTRGCSAGIAPGEERRGSSTSFASSTDTRLDGDGIIGPHPAAFRRKLFVTGKGYLGITEMHVQVGDVVAILLGGQVPFVLRQVGNHHVMVGEAYVHGIMDGEAVPRNSLSVDGSSSPSPSAVEVFEIW